MFGLTLTVLVTAMHAYVLWRTASLPLIKRRVTARALGGSFIALWAVFFLGRTYGHGGTGAMASVLEFSGMNLMAVMFFLTICLLAVDVVTVFGAFMKKANAGLRAVALLAGLALSAAALVQGTRPPVVRKYDLYLSGLPSPMEQKVIVGMSDLHLGSLLGAEWFGKVASRVQALKPDMIVLLGDIFEGHEPPDEEMPAVFHRLSAPLGVWAVPGNHDTHGRGDSLLRLVNENGVRMLRNEWVEIVPGFLLAGVDNPGHHHRRSGAGNLTADALRGKPPGGATVLLSHAPLGAGQAAKSGVGAMLSGHTHGGQIWPFDYIARRRYPLFEGRYDVEGMAVIVCRGTGTWGPRMRLWSPGEILYIRLHGKG